MASIVIKVKYEETLRRFNVAIKEQRLDLSIEGLRLKIHSLFNLPPDSDFSLTYKDEDGDLVTLADDDELHDVVRQDLDPVRITVELRSDQNSQSFSAPSGSAAPSAPSSQNVQPNVAEVVKSLQETLGNVLLNLSSTTPNSQQNPDPNVAKILNSVKEPLAQAMSKLSSDVSSKAASTSPILADLFDGLSKIGQSCVNAALSNSGVTDVSRHNNVVDSGSKPDSEGRKHEDSADKGIKNNGINTANAMQLDPKIAQATGIGASVKNPLCSSLSCDKGKNASCESSSNKKSSSCGMKKSKDTTASKRGAGVSTGFVRAIPTCKNKSSRYEPNRGIESYNNLVHVGGFPFSGIPLTHDQNFKPMRLPTGSLSMGSIFHKGVRCDGCGVLPITGPRFKSKVKYDYDLCSICYSRMGNDVDYTRLDIPSANVHPWSFKAPDASFRQCMMRAHAAQDLCSKFDSRFVMDVNVMDGATMAPLTPFTKIWRMSNTGRRPWNRNLQILCIGGDRFSPSDSVEIQVPRSGVGYGDEIDIAVDFIAPELPGRYISYWRMAEPSGEKFGQQVWVQIQVDPSVDLTRESSPMLNLNLPPDSNETTFPELIDVKAEPDFTVEVGESSAPPIPKHIHNIEMADNRNCNLERASEKASSSVSPSAASVYMPLNPVGDIFSHQRLLEASAPLSPYPATLGELSTGASNVKDDISNLKRASSESASSSISPPTASANMPVSPPQPSSVSYPEVDTYPVLGVHRELSTGASNAQDVNSNQEQVSEKAKFEGKLLKELAQMGFKQVDLNLDILRMNEYDMGRAVEDLCDVSEWDPMLQELKEMGFYDKETNKKLLAKNNGSITRVVMDLIAEETP